MTCVLFVRMTYWVQDAGSPTADSAAGRASMSDACRSGPTTRNRRGTPLSAAPSAGRISARSWAWQKPVKCLAHPAPPPSSSGSRSAITWAWLVRSVGCVRWWGGATGVKRARVTGCVTAASRVTCTTPTAASSSGR